MICKDSNHSHHCPSYRNNALKGASAAAVNQQPTKQLLFSKEEVSLLGKSLEICRYVIGKNQAQYQNSQDILKEISTSINIINARQNKNNSVKGASQICNETKKQSLQNILKLFNLI